MGIYLNPGNILFKNAAEKEIYVDKSLLIEKVWNNAKRMNQYICLSRPRRFGKSTDANMLTAYFSKGCDSRELFQNLKIAGCEMYEEHLNRYNVIHLGYLGYIWDEERAFIPNREVKDTFIDSIEASNWDYIAKVFKNSDDLLEATWRKQESRVAACIENSHYETSILQYNDENALSYTISLAYITAKQYYTIVRELPSGKGFADIVFIPRSGVKKPAMVVELKYDKEAETGISQIKDKKYYLGLEAYLNNLLLVSIVYDKNTKEHSCIIERR